MNKRFTTSLIITVKHLLEEQTFMTTNEDDTFKIYGNNFKIITKDVTIIKDANMRFNSFFFIVCAFCVCRQY